MNFLPPRLSSQELQSLLEKLMAASREGVIITTPDNRIIWVNPAFTSITGYESYEVLGKTPRVLKSDRHDELFYSTIWNCLATNGRWEGEIWNRRKTGEAYPEWLCIHAVQNESGELTHYMAVFSDLTDFERHREELFNEAYHDPLTSLPNRHLFHDRLDVALRRSQTNGNPLGVICFDLDRFKTINDSLGHVAGDIVLSEVSVRLLKLMHQADTLSRFGGDDFYMLLTELRDPEDAAHVAGRILASLADPIGTLDQELHVTASLGITISPADGSDPAHLLRNAELAMYRAKESGRNSFHFFTEDLGNKVQQNLKMENDLRRALARQEFILHYQPRVDVSTGRIMGMEALLRWITPDGDIVYPEAFIPLAEEIGLIIPLGDWVVGEACKQTRIWAKQGFGELKVAVNFSPRQLEQPGLAAKILAVLDTSGLKPDEFEVEVTESVFLKEFEIAQECLKSLADAGIGVALDDFGTGYSPLTYLKKLPITTLKIDKSFVDGLPHDKDDTGIVTSVISIANNLGLQVVAEGVENLEQLEFLRNHSCCSGLQGYLFAGPLSPHDFARFLSQGGIVLPEAFKP